MPAPSWSDDGRETPSLIAADDRACRKPRAARQARGDVNCGGGARPENPFRGSRLTATVGSARRDLAHKRPRRSARGERAEGCTREAGERSRPRCSSWMRRDDCGDSSEERMKVDDERIHPPSHGRRRVTRGADVSCSRAGTRRLCRLATPVPTCSYPHPAYEGDCARSLFSAWATALQRRRLHQSMGDARAGARQWPQWGSSRSSAQACSAIGSPCPPAARTGGGNRGAP
jgi:hypothetical protein